MKKFSVIAFVATLLAVVSCTSYKNVPYLQNSDEVDLSRATQLYDAKIMPKDVLTIVVNCPEDPQAASMFNLLVNSRGTVNSTSSNVLSNQSTLLQYIVENDGSINFPVLGKLQVVGLTKKQLEEDIAKRLTGTYLRTAPIVNVTMANYKFSVLGEVTSPGVYSCINGKINVLEALAMAKDLTIYGRRDSIKIIREDAAGKKEIGLVNLNDANVINSPYYQIQQNDVILVTPNKTKAKNSGIGQETSLWFSATSILVSLAGLLYNVLK